MKPHCDSVQVHQVETTAPEQATKKGLHLHAQMQQLAAAMGQEEEEVVAATNRLAQVVAQLVPKEAQ